MPRTDIDEGPERRETPHGHRVSPRAAPRRPSQARGHLRYEALLDAAEALAIELGLDEVGYYDVVSRAGVSAASAYHYFPTIGAVFTALAERYFGQLRKLAADRNQAFAPERWQDLVVSHHASAAEFYNTHKIAMRLVLGAHPFLDVQQGDATTTRSMARQYVEEFRRKYIVPDLPDLETKFVVAIGIADGVWRVSYVEQGYISNTYMEESNRAKIAYLRTFLPEYLSLRRDPAPGGMGRSGT